MEHIGMFEILTSVGLMALCFTVTLMYVRQVKAQTERRNFEQTMQRIALFEKVG